MAKKEVALREDAENQVIPFGDVPDYIRNQEQTGLENLGQTDFKIPRMLTLDPKSPAVTTFPGEALPGHFWHTGVSRDMGTEFLFVPCTVNKRVVLWNTRESGGGILAMSRDGVHWQQGANQTFTVKIKNITKPVQWSTGRDVKSSGLLEWGTYNPDDERSGPAAQLSYEYLIWLLEYPELSPCFMGCFRTALANAKQLNTALLALKKPITSVAVRAFLESKKKDGNEWSVPNFQLKGWAPKDVADKATRIADASANYMSKADLDADQEPTEDSDKY